MARKEHVGSGFDDFLESEGLLDESVSTAMKRVIAWRLSQAMQEQGISKVAMAELMGTSRPQVDRILDASAGGMTLETLGRAAGILGLRVRFALVPAKTSAENIKKGKVLAAKPTAKPVAVGKRIGKEPLARARSLPAKTAAKRVPSARKRA